MTENNEYSVFSQIEDGGEDIFAASEEANEAIAAETDGDDPQNTEYAEESADSEINKHKYGKFKNPQELLKAYGELEKEFTRRSQRLKELENGKQTKQVKSDEDWKSAVDKFFTEIPAAKAFAKDIANTLLANPQMREDENCLSSALLSVLADKFRTPEQLMEDGQFLNDYVLRSERVKDAIITQYLDDMRQGMPPLTMRSGGLQCVAPKVKPKTIEEAGIMFLKNNK